MSPLVCDTSGILAALDTADPAHEPCRAVLQTWSGALVLSPLVLAELDFLVRARLGADVARRVADDVAAGAYRLEALGAEDVARCVAVDRSHRDLGVGLADASVVVLAERVATNALLTLDERHFRVLRPLGGGSFRLLPADA
ncbi:MAG: PIN domain-containing protein [Mycobacteriales bacterium]|nr:PIN domain-containing protein [Mycobacteriales bacterium]